MSDDVRSPRALYDASATSWVRQQPLSLSDFTARPAVLAMCEPIAGRRVLDLGCGEGYCTRALKRAGAGLAIGIDISAEMIRAARLAEEREPLGIEYHEGDGADLARFDGCFDVVLAMFMHNYLTLADTRRSMAEARRVLRPGGVFVFAVPHPSLPFLRRHEAPFFFDAGDKGYFDGRDHRFPGRIWKRDGTSLDVQAVHKTVEDYFVALADAGFSTLPQVRELRVTAEILALDPAFFAPLGDVPLHLAVRIQRSN